jgi:hypothetical protein
LNAVIRDYLPWLLSAITIWMTMLAGNLHRKRVARRPRQSSALARLDPGDRDVGPYPDERRPLDRLRPQSP